MKGWILLFISLVMFFMVPFVLFVMFGSAFLIGQQDEESESDNEDAELVCDGNQVSEDVERYEHHFVNYAEENDVEDQVDVLMAMAMQESGGQRSDIMQSSESMGDPVNTINSPARSIEQGVSYYAGMYEEADGDTELAMQGYNMGGGYIDYVDDSHDGEHSREAAYEFGEKQADDLGWDNYGDEDYVEHVMRYLEDCEEAETEPDGDGDWMMPIDQVHVTSEFGMRDHPIHNEERLHAGTDFDCQMGDDIYAVADGDVNTAVHQNTGLGHHIKIQHGGDEFSLYAHLTSLDVSEGDEVEQGEKIGECGTTGSSTGSHLHLEHHTTSGAENHTDDKQDPAEILDL